MRFMKWKQWTSAAFSFLRQTWEWLCDRVRSMTLKQTVLSVLIALFILAPTFGAWIYAIDKSKPNAKEFLSVEIYNEKGEVLFSETGDPNIASSSSLVGMFYDLLTLSQPLSAPLSNPDDAPFIRVCVTLNQTNSNLACYFSFKDGMSYYLDETGDAYTISSSLNRRFLASAYAQSFYNSATPPTLLTIESEPILPHYSSWHYRNSQGEFTEVPKQPLTDKTLSYDITGELGIYFTQEPDYCYVFVYEEKEIIYEGTLADLPSLAVNSGNRLRITVRAHWFNAEERDHYGTLGYDFEVQIRNPAIFTLDRKTVGTGEFAIISCQNVIQPQKIVFTSAQEIATPVFHRDGELYRAILPIPEEFKESQLSFQLSYGTSRNEFSLVINQKTKNPVQNIYPQLSLPDAATFRELYQSEWSSLLSSVRYDTQTPLYFRGNFLTPSQLGFTPSYSHGNQIFYGDGLVDSFFAIGSEFLRGDGCGNDVSVWNHGQVIYTGYSDYFGLFAVVDHGGGLRTWYGHLSDVSVEVGDVLRKGEPIGKTGTSGLATAEGFAVVCTVYDTIVHPDTIRGASFDPS